MTKPQLIITGVSGSGKTTVMKRLLKDYPDIYSKPIQYTTRQPRGDGELDDYVFLTHSQFLTKLLNGDFLEYIEYNGALYAISIHFDITKTNIFIAEPVGKASLIRYFKLNSIPYVAAYISIDDNEVKKRLEQRGMTSGDIEKRLTDFKYFSPSIGDKIIHGEHDEEKIESSIHNYIEGALSQT